MRRDRLNDKFLELDSISKMDKATILNDAARMVTQLRGEAQKLKDSNENLKEKIKELKEMLRLSEHKVKQCVDPKLNNDNPPKDVAKMAAVAALRVQYKADFRPNMTIVVKALQPLPNSKPGAEPQAWSICRWSKQHSKFCGLTQVYSLDWYSLGVKFMYTIVDMAWV